MRALFVSAPKSILGLDRFVRLPDLGLNSLAANIDKGLCNVRVLVLHVVNKNRAKFLRKYPWFLAKLVWEKATSESLDMLRFHRGLFRLR